MALGRRNHETKQKTARIVVRTTVKGGTMYKDVLAARGDTASASRIAQTAS